VFQAEDPTAAIVELLAAGLLSVRTPGPAARSAHALFEFLAGATNAPLAGDRFLGVFDPTDELVASEGRDVVPGHRRGLARRQSLSQILGQLVDGSSWPRDRTHVTSVEITIG
jgi:hypothetical protein